MPGRPRRNYGQLTISTGSLLKVLAVVLGVWFLWYLRDVFAILIAAVLLAALVEPAASWFHRHGIPRGLGVVSVYLLLGLIATLVVSLMIPAIVNQASQVLTNFASLYSRFIESFAELRTLSTNLGLEENFRAGAQSLQQGLYSSVAEVFSTVRGFVSGAIALFIVLVLAFYLVVEEENARKWFKSLAPEEYQPFISQLMHKLQKRIGAWLRGQLILGIAIGALTYVGLTIIGVPYALLLAIIAGSLEIIPYFGPVIATIPAAAVAFSISPFTGVVVLIFYVLLQQFESGVLTPTVMEKVAGINPILSIVALLIGVKLGGAIGALLAIPVALMLATVLEELFEARSLRA